MYRTLCLLAAASFVAVGCRSTRPDETLSVSNAGYSLDKLFTDPNGNSVYRFIDRGEFHYYVVGPAGPQMVPGTARRDRNAEVGLGLGVGLGAGFGAGVGVGSEIGR